MLTVQLQTGKKYLSHTGMCRRITNITRSGNVESVTYEQLEKGLDGEWHRHGGTKTVLISIFARWAKEEA